MEINYEMVGKSTKDSKDFQTLGRGPGVKSNESLGSQKKEMNEDGGT